MGNILPRACEVFTSASPLSLFYYVKRYGEDALDGLLIYIDEVEASRFVLPMLRSLTGQTEITPRHLPVYDAEVLDLKGRGIPHRLVHERQDLQLGSDKEQVHPHEP